MARSLNKKKFKNFLIKKDKIDKEIEKLIEKKNNYGRFIIRNS